MVKYKCFRCGYETHIKTQFLRHLNRKIICICKINNISIKSIYDYYFQDEPLDIENNDTNRKCIYCNKIFKNYKNKWRHEKNNCKKKDKENNDNMHTLVDLLNQQLIETKKEIKKRDETIEKREQQIDELIKKTGFNITQNSININLLGYYNTDTSYITDNDIMNCISHNMYCIPNLIKKIHFNPNKPENHNIYISNIKNNYVMLYDGKKWNLENREEAITNLIDDKEYIVEQQLEEWIENGNKYPDIMNKFNRYLEKKESSEILNDIKEEIKLILFNNRNLIVEKQNRIE